MGERKGAGQKPRARVNIDAAAASTSGGCPGKKKT